jgi:hypothetical protein
VIEIITIGCFAAAGFFGLLSIMGLLCIVLWSLLSLTLKLAGDSSYGLPVKYAAIFTGLCLVSAGIFYGAALCVPQVFA